MANIKKTKKDDKVIIKVSAATDNADREGYAKVNGKIIPYDVPVAVTMADYKALKAMKESRKGDQRINPRQIMEELQIPQEQANRIARMSEKDFNNSIYWKNKYVIHRIK